MGLGHGRLVGSEVPTLADPGEPPVRATTLLNRVLGLSGVGVVRVDPDSLTGAGPVTLDVALQRRKLACPSCSFTTRHRYDRRDIDSSWRHLDLGGRVCRLRLRRRRLACPEHGVITEAVEFARPGARFTRDFEDLVVWLVTRSDKTTVACFARVAWRTVGAMCERVTADVLDPARLEGLVDIRGRRDLLAQAPQVSEPGHQPRHLDGGVGAHRARTRPRSERSSTTCPTVRPRTSRRSRWTWDPPTPRPSASTPRRR